MRRQHVLTALAIFAVIGTIHYSPSLAEAWQGDVIKNLTGMMTNADTSLIHKVGADSYSGGYPGMSGPDMKSGATTGTYSSQGTMPSNPAPSTGEYKYGSPSNDGRYGSSPSDSYLKKESSGSSSGLSGGPYGGAVYGGVPSTPSADPMIKDLSR
jgi:hypothetical protein